MGVGFFYNTLVQLYNGFERPQHRCSEVQYKRLSLHFVVEFVALSGSEGHGHVSFTCREPQKAEEDLC